MARIIAGHPNPHAGHPAGLIRPCHVQGELSDDADIEVGDVEPDLGALSAPPDGDMEELRVVAQVHFAAAVHLVSADPEVCFGNRVTRSGLVQSLEGLARRA